MRTKCLFLVLAIFSACDATPGSEPPPDQSQPEPTTANVEIVPGYIRTHLGARTVKFKASVSVEPDTASISLEWESSNSALCEIDETGACSEIEDLGQSTITVRVRDADGQILSEDNAQLFSEVAQVYIAQGNILDISQGEVEGRILAGGGGHLAASDDGGTTWSTVTGVPPRFRIDRIIHSPVDPDLVLATAEYYTNRIVTGLYISEDGGVSWQEIAKPSEPFTRDRVVGAAFHPEIRNKLFILTLLTSGPGRWQLYSTDNLGSTWTLVSDLAPRGASFPSLLIDPTEPSRMYIGANGSLTHTGGYISSDGGTSWSAWYSGAPESLYTIDSDGRLYARKFTEGTTSSPQQLVRSSDHGQTWDVLIEDAERNVALVSTFGSNVVAVGLTLNTNAGHLIRLSLDGGKTWEEIDLSPANNTTSGRPNAIDIISYDESLTELILSISDPRRPDDPGHLWKLLYHNL